MQNFNPLSAYKSSFCTTYSLCTKGDEFPYSFQGIKHSSAWRRVIEMLTNTNCRPPASHFDLLKFRFLTAAESDQLHAAHILREVFKVSLATRC
jgi:hypothetical protein